MTSPPLPDYIMEAAIQIAKIAQGEPTDSDPEKETVALARKLAPHVHAAVMAERERCAQVADEEQRQWKVEAANSPDSYRCDIARLTAKEVAASIRAGGTE